jgi:hypothetical protein
LSCDVCFIDSSYFFFPGIIIIAGINVALVTVGRTVTNADTIDNVVVYVNLALILILAALALNYRKGEENQQMKEVSYGDQQQQQPETTSYKM